ncbi:MAG: ribulose-phosphate 3-epimerase [bacterium]|nr:ribulose-phosphate 3-epimerase [bacterium]
MAPSVLSADFSRLENDLSNMTAAGADFLHLDVMDGHFVPNISFGPFICSALRKLSDLPLDAHLMISRPDKYLEPFAKSGIDGLTIHVEAEADVPSTLKRIGELGMKRGISLNPGTDLGDILPYLDQVDLVLVMSVQPGFGGQKFNPVAVEKIAELARRREDEGLEYLINVDGGINDVTGPECREAGADILVSGSWLFGAEDRSARVDVLGGRVG